LFDISELDLNNISMIFSKKINPVFTALFFSIFLIACGGETNSATATSKAVNNKITTTPKTSNPVIQPASATDPKVKIAGENMTVKSGEEFCMNIKADNFIDMVSMQYSTNWDSKLLEFKGVKNFQIKDLSKDQFGKPTNEPNSIRLAWIAMDVQPVSLFNEALIYQICFKAIGKSGTSTQVTISDKPMAAEFGKKAKQGFKAAQWETQPATVTIE